MACKYFQKGMCKYGDRCRNLHNMEAKPEFIYYKPETMPLNLNEAFNQFLSNGNLEDILNDNKKIQDTVFNSKSLEWLASKSKYDSSKSNNNLYFKNMSFSCEKLNSKKISACIIVLMICWDIFPHLQNEILELLKIKLKFKTLLLFLHFLLIDMINIPPTEITSIYFEMVEFICSTIDYSATKSIKTIQSTWNKMISIYFPVFIIHDDVLLFLKLFSYSHTFNEYIDEEFIIISMDKLKEKFHGDLNILKIIFKFERMQQVRHIKKMKELEVNHTTLQTKFDELQAKFDELQTSLGKIKPDAYVEESDSSSNSGYDSY